MSGRERTRDRLKPFVFQDQATSSAISLHTEIPSPPYGQQTDPIGPNQPTLQIGISRVPTSQEVHSPTSTSAVLQTTGSSSSSTPAVLNAPVRDLWAEALQKLSDKDKTAIKKTWPPLQTNATSDIPQQLIAVVEKKREECEEKRWRFKINGRQIILRDVAEKIIVWINKFKEIGDVAVNFDPVHAALPWAGVRFLLQTVIAESQQMGALLVGLDALTNLINRCKIYEILYLNHGQAAQTSSNLEIALVKLYVTMLQFLVSANILYDCNAGVRILRAFLEPDKVVDFVDKCEKLQAHVDVEANNCDHAHNRVAHSKMTELERLLVDLTTPIIRTDRQVTKLWDRLNESRRTKILAWTSSIPYEDNHYTARQGHVGSTGEWLLKHERYLEWRGSSASMILWLHGIPGAGKTKLVSTIVDSLRSALRDAQNDESLAYFYCDRNQSDRRNPAMILSSFVKQLSTSQNGDAIQPSLVRLYSEKEKTGFASRQISIEESEKVLLELVNIYPQTTLVLDALDECDKRTRGRLIEILDGLLEQSSKPIKIFISSRPDQDIRDRFDSGPNVGIQATDNQGDISTFVDSKIGKSPEKWRKRISADLRRDIRKTLVEKSNGMFQWASLQIDQLLDLPPLEKVIRDRLGKLPKDLEKAYDEIYANIRAQDERVREIADRAFQWVMCSCTPLSTANLIAAVCQDPEMGTANSMDDMDIDIILGACHNLVVVNSQLHVCRFSHLSVQEYFESRLWSQSQANGMVAKVCLSLLNDPTQCRRDRQCAKREEDDEDYADAYEDESEEKEDITWIVRYAMLHWRTHVQKHGEENIDTRLATLLKQFLGSMNETGPAYRSWHRMATKHFRRNRYHFGSRAQFRKTYEQLVSSSQASFAVCTFGFHKILSDWWVSGFKNIEEQNDEGQSLLQLAAAGGFASIIKELLRRGANINAGSKRNGSAITAASEEGHEAIVRLLLEYGADVNVGNALEKASANGHDAIVKLLLEHGADIKAEGSYYGTALQAASYGGNDAIVRRLLEAGADVNAQGGEYSNALQAASFQGNGAIVRQLLEAGADVNARGGYCNSALQAALYRNNETTVKLLLEARADVNAQGGEYSNALLAASYRGSGTIVKLLLKVGADANAQGGEYSNALQIASYQGNNTNVKLLLEAGADVNAQGGKYGNALQAASYGGNDAIVRQFLEAGAEVNARGGYFNNALQAASYRGNNTIVKLLLEAGANVNAQGGKDSSALQAASSGNYYATVKLLLKAGADVNAQGGEYSNALQIASYRGNNTILKLLLEAGADMNVQGGKYGNALQAASNGGYYTTVKLLLKAGAVKSQ